MYIFNKKNFFTFFYLLSFIFLNYSTKIHAMEEGLDSTDTEISEISGAMPKNTMAFVNQKDCLQDEKTVFIITGTSCSGKSTLCRRLMQELSNVGHLNQQEWGILAADQDQIIDEIYNLENKMQPLNFTKLKITDLDEKEEELFSHYFGAPKLSLINAYLGHKIITHFLKFQETKYIICDMVLEENTDKKEDFINFLKYFGPNIKCYTIFVFANPLEALKRSQSRKDTRSPFQVLEQMRTLLTPSPTQEKTTSTSSTGSTSTSTSSSPQSSPEIFRLSRTNLNELCNPQNFSPNTPRHALARLEDQMAGEFQVRNSPIEFQVSLSPKITYDLTVNNSGPLGIKICSKEILEFILEKIRL